MKNKVETLGTGRYRVRWTINGKKQSKTFHDYKEAKTFASNLNELKKELTQFIPKQPQKEIERKEEMPILNDWFNEVIEVMKVKRSASTCKVYKCVYDKQISKILGRYKIDEIKTKDLERVVGKIKTGNYSPSYINLITSLLKVIFEEAEKNGYIDRSPARYLEAVRSMKSKKGVTNVLSPEEEELLLREIRYYNYSFLEFTLETGVRVAELCGLTWDCVDFDKKTIKITKQLICLSKTDVKFGQPKSEEGYREIPLTRRAYEILQERKKISQNEERTLLKYDYFDKNEVKTYSYHNTDFVFKSTKNGMLKPFTVRELLDKCCREAGISHISPHDLRHTFATKLLKKDIPPLYIKKFLGHSSLDTTLNTYVHIDHASLSSVMDRMNA